MRLLDKCLTYDSAVLEHVLQIDQVTVVHMLSEIVGIMEMDYSLFVRLDYFLRKKYSRCYVTADLARHVIALYAVDSRIFI